MSHTFHQLYYHFVWATHSRDPHLHRSFRPQFLEILHEETYLRGGQPIRHNSMFDHVHLLVRLPPTLAPATFVGGVKGATAFRVNRDIKPSFKLRWQEGYGVLTLRKDELQKVSTYIDNQEEHHRVGGKVSDLLECISVEEDDWQQVEAELAKYRPPEGGQ